MKRTFAVVLSLLFVMQLFSQSEEVKNTSKRLSLLYGQTYSLKIDKTYSRLAKQGLSHHFNLGYVRITESQIMDIQTHWRSGKLNSNGNKINLINDLASILRFRYLRKTDRFSKEKLSVYAGGNIHFRANIWFPPPHTLRYGWDMNLGLGLSTTIIYQIKPRWQLQYDMDLSLLGILWRSHNNGQQLVTEEVQLENGTMASAFEVPRFGHLFNAFYFDHLLVLDYNFSKRLDFQYHLALSYLHLLAPLVKKGYQISNQIGLTYKF